MAKSMSISCRNNGYRWSINHNNRTFKNENVDESRSHLNVYMVQNDIKEVYSELFDNAVARYNSSQKRKDRHIENYYKKIQHDKKTHVAQEVIFQVGSLEDMNVFDDNWETTSEVLQEFVKDFQERNPNLRVFNCVLHMDESVPHLHINYIPFYHANRGLETRVGMKQALIEMGFDEKQPFQEWRNREVSLIEKLLSERTIERKLVGSHKYLDIPEFKEMKNELAKNKERVNEIKSEIKDLESTWVFGTEVEISKNSKGHYENEDVEELIECQKALYLQKDKSYHHARSLSEQVDELDRELYAEKSKNKSLENKIEQLEQEKEKITFENLSYKGYIRSLGNEREKDYKDYLETLKAFKTEIQGYLERHITDVRKFVGYVTRSFKELTGYEPTDNSIKQLLGKDSFSFFKDIILNKSKNKNNDLSL